MDKINGCILKLCEGNEWSNIIIIDNEVIRLICIIIKVLISKNSLIKILILEINDINFIFLISYKYYLFLIYKINILIKLITIFFIIYIYILLYFFYL